MRRVLVAATMAALLVGCGNDKSADVTTTSAAADATTTPPVTESMPAADTTMPAASSTPDTAAAASTVLHVPADFATIQDAVDSAAPGALVMIAAGTYHEAVNVQTDGITLRGEDRNTVILDGELKLDNGVRILGAKGVVVENMTAVNYTHNGFFWTGVDGYRGSYLTAYRTGDYGVYSFDSVNGQFDHIYAAGSPDAGLYIGGCFPCNAVVDHVVSEHNGLGYSGTNSGGELYIVNSTFRFNRAGVVPNSGSYEMCYPERSSTIVGNLVYSNNQPDTPAIDVALLAMGNGILSAGGVRNTIERNQVYDHDNSGIGLVPFLEEDPNDAVPAPTQWDMVCADQKQLTPVNPGGAVLWDSMENRVTGNVLSDNRLADLLVASAGSDLLTLGNCFAGNEHTTSAPTAVETLMPCDGTGSGDAAAGAFDITEWLVAQHPPSVDWKTATLPDLQPQDNMPDAATAPFSPAGTPEYPDIQAITVPAKPA